MKLQLIALNIKDYEHFEGGGGFMYQNSFFFVNQFQTLLCVAVVWGNLWTTWPRNTVLSRTITCTTLWTDSEPVINSKIQTELENCGAICRFMQWILREKYEERQRFIWICVDIILYYVITETKPAIIWHSKRVNWKNPILVIIF